jgi:hypothetical protein
MDTNKESSTTSLVTTSSGLQPLTPEQQTALNKYLPQSFMPVVRQITSVSQALKAGTSSLAKIKKNIGTERVEDLIKVYLINLNEMLDLKKPLSENAMDSIAATLVTQYFSLTMVDVAYVLEKAARGEYGELYESITMPKVLKWFREYFDERCNTAEEQSRNADYEKHPNHHFRERSSAGTSEQRQFSKQYAISKRVEAWKEQNNIPPNKL